MNFKDNLVKFDYNLPIYNWFYPLLYEAISENIRYTMSVCPTDIYKTIGSNPKNRSLYLHIPYCEDICAFCPFTREVLTEESTLDLYIDALINEIKIKSKYKNLSEYPISSIFIGGGTPSILAPRHIRKLGKALKNSFNLSKIKEFSFEMNAKTVTPDRIEALQEIGVTHARMGVQTFNPLYRKIFSLSATERQIYDGCDLLNRSFDNVCVDLLYGMHGESTEDFLRDLHFATSLNTKTIDVFPINNMVVQKRLLAEYKKRNLEPASGLSKFSYNLVLSEYMRHNGFLPHNGHGFVKARNNDCMQQSVLTREYRFEYHETVYGYRGHEAIGFGPSAFSSFEGFVVGNTSDIQKYLNAYTKDKNLIFEVAEYNLLLDEIRGIVLHLPYHGYVDKHQFDFNNLPYNTNEKLLFLLREGLIYETDDEFMLTKKGWYWYVNLLFYLSPTVEQKKLENMIKNQNIGNDWKFGMMNYSSCKN